MLVRFSGVDTSAYSGYSTGFYDLTNYWVSYNQKSASQIAYGVSHGWINGYPDGTFRPNNLICRSEVVAMVNRVVGRIPDKQTIFVNMNLMNHFVDVPVSHWAFYDIMEATNSHNVVYNNYGTENWESYR